MAYSYIKNINQNQRDLLEVNHQALVRKAIFAIAKIVIAGLISIAAIYFCVLIYAVSNFAAAGTGSSAIVGNMGLSIISVIIIIAYLVCLATTVVSVINEARAAKRVEERILEK